jgi:hypothetical protein
MFLQIISLILKHDSCTWSSNCDVAKNHKKKTWVKKTSTSTGSETKHKEPISRPLNKDILLKGKRRNYCSHCNLSGHFEKKCWKLHPEIHPTSSIKSVKETMQKETPPTTEKALLQKESTLRWLGKQWLLFLQTLIMLCYHYVNSLGWGRNSQR